MIKTPKKRKSHTRYYVKGKQVRSVTNVIAQQLGWNKNALLGWTRKLMIQGKDPQKELRKAGNIGTLAHKMIEEFIKGGSVYLDDYTPEEISKAKTAYYGYYDWQRNKQIKFVETEMKLVSDKYNFGGTFDGVAIIGSGNAEKLVLIDFKTSANLYDEFIVQLAAYRQLWNEHIDQKYTLKNTPVANEHPRVLESRKKMWKIKGAIVLQVKKDERGFVEHNVNIKDLNWGWKVFKHILKLQELKNERS